MLCNPHSRIVSGTLPLLPSTSTIGLKACPSCMPNNMLNEFGLNLGGIFGIFHSMRVPSVFGFVAALRLILSLGWVAGGG